MMIWVIGTHCHINYNDKEDCNYFEPDELYGYGYLEAFKKIIGK